MRKYSIDTISNIRVLRSQGKTYREIQKESGLIIPKSSFNWLCRSLKISEEARFRLNAINIDILANNRRKAVLANRLKREKYFSLIHARYMPVAQSIRDVSIGKVALAMLCLGEATKYNPKTMRGFSLGNSDRRIIVLFLKLLEQCFNFSMDKVRATVQCRADQDVQILEDFWQKETGIPKRLFYKARIDKRTKGKPTKDGSYHGVLRVDYFDLHVQHELECLAALVYNELK